MRNTQGIKTLLSGALMGLAGARMGYDFLPPDRLWMIAPVAAGAFVIGVAIPSRSRWSLWGALLYMAAPVPMPRLATLGACLAIAGILESVAQRHAMQRRVMPMLAWGLPGITALIALLLTLAPGLIAADGGELQLVAAKWGVAHPPGYPLYTLMAGILARLLPIGAFAWRVNLFSALTGAATVGTVAYLLHRETGRALAGWAGALILLSSTTFWMTATQASVRPLTILFAVLMLEALLAYRAALRSDRPGKAALVRFGLAAGFGAAHHGSVVFIGGVFAVGILCAGWRKWRYWWIAPAVALTGALPILYLPLHTGGLFAPDYLRTLDGLRYHVMAEGFAGDMFALAAPHYWAERWQVMAEVFWLQWQGWIIFPLVGVALAHIALRDKLLGGILAGALVTHSFVSGTYRAPQIVEYALPAYAMIAIILGVWIGRLRHPYPVLAGALVLFVGANSFYSSWMTMQRLYAEDDARLHAQTLLENTPANTNILAAWHHVSPILYLQHVEGWRPDVHTYYVTSRGAPTPMAEWAAAIKDHVSASGRVMVTQVYPEMYRHLPYTFDGCRATLTPDPLPESPGGVSFGGHTLMIQDSVVPQTARAGEYLPVTLDWALSAAAPYGSLTTFVHLGAQDLPPLAQVDLPVQTTAPGTISPTYRLFVPATLPPGEWALMVGMYTSEGVLLTANGTPRETLGALWIHPAQFPLPTQHSLAVRMGSARLKGWDYDTTLPHAPVLYLHWQLATPNHRYMVTLTGDDGAPYAQETATTAGRTGYWTSAHILPPDVPRVTVQMDGRGDFRLPELTPGSRYVLFGDVAALVGWQITHHDDEHHNAVQIGLDWLAVGATDAEIGLALDMPHRSASQENGVPSILEAIPTTKWGYNHRIHSQQTVILEDGAPLERVRLSLFDPYTGQSVFVVDTRLTADGPGVRLGP